MRIGNYPSSIEFEFVEKHLLDVSVSVKMQRDGFCGAVTNVWISSDDARSFLDQLSSLEKNEIGEAELLNMSSPSDKSPLVFRIYKTDDLGHLAISVVLQKLIHTPNTLDRLATSIAVEIDREFLSAIIRDFQALLLR